MKIYGLTIIILIEILILLEEVENYYMLKFLNHFFEKLMMKIIEYLWIYDMYNIFYQLK